MSIKITLAEIKQIVREEIEIHKYGEIKNKKKYINESKGMVRNLAKLRKLIQEQLRILSAEEKYQFAKKSLSPEMHNIISNHLDKLNSETIAKEIIKNVDKQKIEKIKKVMFTSQIGGKDEYNEEKASDFSAYVHRMIGEYLTSLMKSADESDVFEPVSGKKPISSPGDFPLGGSGIRDLSQGSGVSIGQGRGSGTNDTDMQFKGGSGVTNKTGSSVR